MVGGTGLYIKSLQKGFFRCPPADQELRESLNMEYETNGPEKLHQRLMRIDPESAGRIHPNDRVRITRALEVFHLTNRRLSELMEKEGRKERPLKNLKLCLKVDREDLYRRINERSKAMVDSGLTEEVENLLKNGYSADLKPMKAIGYRHIIRYIRGDWSLTETIHNLQRDTRRYAKRQLTWFRADPEMQWFMPEDFNSILQKLEDFAFDTA